MTRETNNCSRTKRAARLYTRVLPPYNVPQQLEPSGIYIPTSTTGWKRQRSLWIMRYTCPENATVLYKLSRSHCFRFAIGEGGGPCTSTGFSISSPRCKTSYHYPGFSVLCITRFRSTSRFPHRSSFRCWVLRQLKK